MERQKTFKAWLTGSHLDWVDDVPEMGERSLQVQVTILENQPEFEPQRRGERMAEILEKLAATQGIEEIDPMRWQQETRQERSLPGR